MSARLNRFALLRFPFPTDMPPDLIAIAECVAPDSGAASYPAFQPLPAWPGNRGKHSRNIDGRVPPSISLPSQVGLIWNRRPKDRQTVGPRIRRHPTGGGVR